MFNKGNILIPVVVIAILLIAAVALIILNPFKKTGGNLIEESLAKLSEEKSFKVDGKINVQFQQESNEAGSAKGFSVEANFTELFDKRESEEPKASVDIGLNLGAEGITMQIKGNMIIVAKDIFVKITSLPAMPFLGAVDLSEIKNQWFKISKETIEGATSGEAEKIDEKQLSQDLTNLVKGKEIFKLKKELGPDEYDNVKANHYSAELKKQAVKEIVPELMKLGLKYVSENEKQEYQKNIDEFLNGFELNFDKFWSNIEPIEMEFWTDGSGLRRLKMEKSFSYSENGADAAKTTINVSFDLKFSEFNKKFEIAVPENAKPIEDLLGNFLNPQGLSLPEETQGSELNPEPEIDFNFE